ncbi:unnamed protein product [Moneuplotes crassus]|uniref:Uncharacterized protein n=1 Tax=Euplotes crassus TaxID=5936 RepID=A0AAD1X9J9_EUPCR|nr:unnamed protein product [Moneuplotes crassus]
MSQRHIQLGFQHYRNPRLTTTRNKVRSSSQKLLSRNYPINVKKLRECCNIGIFSNANLKKKFIQSKRGPLSIEIPPKNVRGSIRSSRCNCNKRMKPVSDYINKMTDPTYISPTLHKAMRYNPKIVLKKAKISRPNTVLENRDPQIVQSDIKNSLPSSLRQQMKKVAREQKCSEFVQYEKVAFSNKGIWTKNNTRNKKEFGAESPKLESFDKEEDKGIKSNKNLNCLINQEEIREIPSDQESIQREHTFESFERKRAQKRRIKTQRSARTGYMAKRPKMASTQYNNPFDLKEHQKPNLETFFPKSSKARNLSKNTFEDNFTSAARKGLKTREASRRGFGYFYKSSYQKYYKPPDLQRQASQASQRSYSKSMPKFGNDASVPTNPYTVFSLNEDYKSFLDCPELSLWDTYESHWQSFKSCPSQDLTADQIPLPPNNITFVLHMRRILEQNSEITKAKNTKEQWKKCVKEALRRYHPDKFIQNFGKYIPDLSEKEILLEKINQLCKIVTTCFHL